MNIKELKRNKKTVNVSLPPKLGRIYRAGFFSSKAYSPKTT